MKNPVKSSVLPLLPMTAGIFGILFRFWLLSTGVDEKGLLVRSHPAHVLIWILVPLTLALVALAAQNAAPQCEKPFPASRLGAAGCVLAALGIFISDLLELNQDPLSIVSGILGFLAALGCLHTGWCRLQGRQGSIWWQSIITLYFMIHLIFQYRQWSAEPQLQNYFFPLLASVFLMLWCYHRAVLDQNHKNRRSCLFFGQCALFFSCISVTTGSWLFYLAMALWTASDLSVKQEASQ